jgi:hypothetical protein
MLSVRLSATALLVKPEEANANWPILLALAGLVVEVWRALSEKARDREHMVREQQTHALARSNLVYAKFLDLHDEMGTLDAFVQGQLDPVTGRPFLLDTRTYAQVVRGRPHVYREDLPSTRSDVNRVEALWLNNVMAQENLAPVPVGIRQPVTATAWQNISPILARNGIDPDGIHPRFLRPFREARAVSKTGKADVTMVAGYSRRDGNPFYTAV